MPQSAHRDCSDPTCDEHANWRPTIVLVAKTLGGVAIRMKLQRWYCTSHKDSVDAKRLVTPEAFALMVRRMFGANSPVPDLSSCRVEWSQYHDQEPPADAYSRHAPRR